MRSRHSWILPGGGAEPPTHLELLASKTHGTLQFMHPPSHARRMMDDDAEGLSQVGSRTFPTMLVNGVLSRCVRGQVK